MSTDRKRLTSAIQRIAREDPEIRALLKDYRNSGGKPLSSATTGSGAEDRKTCCDGSSSGNINPGSGTRDTSDGGQDASDGLDSDDPANLDMGPGTLNGLKECVTGQPVVFQGSDCVPPAGWDDCKTPPPEHAHDPNYIWRARSENATTEYIGRTAAEAAKNSRSNYDPLCINGATFSYSSESEMEFKHVKCDGTVIENIWAASRISCNDIISDLCGSVAPEISWPSDEAVSIFIQRGKLVGSKFDPENDGSWSKPRDSVELCDDFGNSFELKPAASGGWKTISSQNPGDGYLYNSNGEQIARISGSEFSDPNV